MSGGYYRRPLHMVSLAVLASLAGLGGFSQGGAALKGVDVMRAGLQNADPARPTPARPSSNLAKLRSLDFLRGGHGPRHAYTGVRMSVAQGKRMARKKRNVQRHKKHWK